jgi:Domain of unknown function (DUF4157)
MPEHAFRPVYPVRAAWRPPPSASLAHAERQADAAAARGRAVPSSPLRVSPTDSTHARSMVPRSPGVALDSSAQNAMAQRFSFDFSRVRVYSDSRAADLASGMHARAYTVGHHIVFGAGQYAPQSAIGRALLAHELSHVVQQSTAGVLALQRQDQAKPAPTPLPDPEVVLGQRLVKDFPSGVALAFYAPMPEAKEEARNAAQKWAMREQALAIKGKAVTAANAVFGEPMSDDDHPLTTTLQAIGKMLTSAVAKVPQPMIGPLPPGIGPANVRTLAVFAHGTSNWCGLGSITSARAASVIKSIVPTLASDVNVILYSCNAGREPDASEDWVKGTMRPGGKSSLAAVVRDALIAEGKSGSVWGHTTTGHVTENFALREFPTSFGKGSEGASFVARYVFTGDDKLTTASELLDGVRALGYEVSPRGANKADAAVESEMYRCYAEANRELTFGGGKLAESAPVHPVEVGKQIRDYWTATYWPGRKSKAIDALARELVASGRAKKPKKAKLPATP